MPEPLSPRPPAGEVVERALARQATEAFELELAKAGKTPRTARLPFPMLAWLVHLLLCVGMGCAIGAFTVFMVFLVVNKLLHLV